MSEVLWLNKETLEERYLDKFSVFPYHSSWVEVPEGATFATGDKDDCVFRKDGWYYYNQEGEWVKGNVTIKNLRTHEFVKLFWVKGGKDNVFKIERLLGCEVKIINPFGVVNNGHIYKILWDKVVFVCCGYHFEIVHIDDLKLFTDYGDELTFDEYVKLYYGESMGNLIDSLGGYEAAKLEGEEWGFDEFLLRKLLEYRRKHKFYEVGDLVTYKAHFKGGWREGFGKITEIDEDLEIVNIDENVGVAISEIEHANDEEIKAGRRL